MKFEIQYWDEIKFRNSENEWQDLLARSNADPLFNSWLWMHGWWRHQGATLKGKLLLIAFYQRNELVGLAPFYIRDVVHRKVVRAKRIELIGSGWRDSSLVFSEYLDVIVDKAFSNAVINELAIILLANDSWTDFVVSNTSRDSLLATLFNDRLHKRCYVRETDSLCAHVAKLPQSFAQYVISLSSDARRKVWNHRSRLENVEVRDRSAGVDAFFEEIDILHARRWGARHYEGMPRQFHLDFARKAAERKQLRLSELRVNDKTISLMYNIRVGQKEYNIQSAFDSSIVPGTSPGYLHLGYSIEHACNDNIAEFDLLGGTGQNRDYKSDFKTTSAMLVTFQSIRNRPLAWLYKTHDKQYLRSLGISLSCAISLVEEPDVWNTLFSFQ